jgi:hypothetical protein
MTEVHITPTRARPDGTSHRIRTKLSRITSALPALRETFDWKWMALGIVFIITGNILAFVALQPLLNTLIEEQERVLTGAGLMAGVSLLVFLFGGILVGRMSSGLKVKEPAVAAVASVLILFVLQLFLGMINVIGLILGSPLCFMVAYGGGLLGEKWQMARIKHHAPHPHDGQG